MYLKSIEIHGFKSFANKTVLDFSKGVTGIVGPNGSGKSNISDAVRWVLGEQKVKQLRGSSMQDVIFAGTQLRRPQSSAFVAITLDNSDRILNIDYDEVTVSRRLYRSGESEYMLNGTECRLKDVNELFYDTGIGKDGYSIIGQGQVEKILSGKPEERRDLFDEAVGIVKFKRRKALAEKKLSDEQANLTRVTDILNELERQVGPLKKQSDEARQYLSIRDELVNADSNLFIRDMDDTLKGLDSVNENANTVNDELDAVKKESEELNGKYTEIESKIRALDEELSRAKDEINKSDLLKTNLRGQIDVLNEQINTEKNNALHYTQRINALQKDMFDRISQIEDNLSLLKWIKEQISFIKDNKAGTDEMMENIDLDLEMIRSTMDETELTVSSCMGADFQLEDRPVKESEKASNIKSDGFLSNIEEQRKELERLNLRLEEVKQLIASDSQLVMKLGEMNQQLRDQINHKTREHDSLRNRLETLRNLAERYEGYGNAIKMVMDRRDQEHGILGVVADLIEVPKDYETAIETALGGSIQNVVTEDENTAKNMVQFLKQHRYGRATFLPLTNIKGKRDENCERASSEKGAIGLGCDLIKFDSKYKTLSEYLLGRVLVVDRIETALQIQRKYRQSLRIVTLEGDLLNPGGSISGGSFKNNSNLMGRKRELEEIEEHIETSKKTIDELSRKLSDSESRRDIAKASVESHRQEIEKLTIEQNTQTMAIASQINVEYSSLSTRTDFVTENLHRLNSELEDITGEKGMMEDSQQNSDSVLQGKEEKIRELEALIQNADTAAEALNGQMAKNEESKAKLQEERASFFQKKDEISVRLLDMEKESMRVQNKKEKLDEKIDKLTNYMFDEYGLTYEEAKKRYSDEYKNTNEVRTLVNQLKGQLKALGPVNLDAIEQYKEVSERYEFLNNQYLDLTESEKSLNEIIEELDQGMRKQFNENFKLIQEQFNKTFKILFGGGQGRLELDTDDPDVLTASISIIAEPPGKKLQNMMQLSGGEKALTAIALLFAIQSLKPSPFCLLDEIEAALDDSNVSRFAEYLHTLVQTQFIVITHRRGTMENTDRLFGITMQEKGVSTLVSVDLVQDQLDA
ncbi:chromosome segregation protein SMC [Oribacterium sp. WCC10]|uniref:chromosome segregation protein SMC n=1 Tax=Oribacterium sp. WCC10 TaxID=1855343 RepID=UPI0008EC7B02|nr:chromosome segregation protein SMC [Oribacterium sp. WCC10]SFG09015.1 condensin subunit Smc [Oribacterium sp. WCC10]